MSRLGKRGSVKFPANKSIKNIYDIYIKKFVSKKPTWSKTEFDKLALSEKDVKIIAKDILDYKMDRIMNHSECAKLHYNLGEIRIKKKKIYFNIATKDHKYLKTDWGHFQKTGEIIKHLNEDRNYHRYGFYWLCKKGPIGKNVYKFVALRKDTRGLKTILKTTKQEYFE